MKIRVNKSVTGGRYRISFQATEFTEQERAQFSKFGIPTVVLLIGSEDTSLYKYQAPVTGLKDDHAAVFKTPEAAKAYETKIVNDIREAVEKVRGRRDDFTSIDEVSI